MVEDTHDYFELSGSNILLALFFFFVLIIGLAFKPDAGKTAREPQQSSQELQLSETSDKQETRAETVDTEEIIEEEVIATEMAGEDLAMIDEDESLNFIAEMREQEQVQAAEPSREDDPASVIALETTGKEDEETLTAGESLGDKQSWQTCKIKELGVKFMCDLNWEIRKSGEESLIILSQNPVVTLNFGKINSNITMIEQLTTWKLEEKDNYKEGFRTENVDFAGHRAVMVKAFSKKNPEVRYVDYLFIHDAKLYAVNFSLYPKEKWEEGKFLIQEVASSFNVIPSVGQ